MAEIATSVHHVFRGGLIPDLDTDDQIRNALAQSRNVLSELGGLYLALWQAPAGRRLTIVHDYSGVAEWMEDRWKMKDPTVGSIVDACREIVERKHLDLEFVWQKGHTSSWAGRHDKARFNARADQLATEGSSTLSG